MDGKLWKGFHRSGGTAASPSAQSYSLSSSSLPAGLSTRTRLAGFGIIILLIGSVALCGAVQAANVPDALLDAIERVESGGRANAIGDGGKSIGAYQIGKLFWRDGCEYLKVDWPYSAAKDKAKARQVVRAYLTRYGKGKTLEQLARIHNGGPNGDKKAATLAYWNRVKKELAK
jgi:hypothetical protein